MLRQSVETSTELEEFERALRAGYEVYGQTAYALLSKARLFRVICVSDLPEEDVRQMGMEPAPDLDSAMALLEGEAAHAPGYILPFGGQVLPVLAGEAIRPLGRLVATR